MLSFSMIVPTPLYPVFGPTVSVAAVIHDILSEHFFHAIRNNSFVVDAQFGVYFEMSMLWYIWLSCNSDIYEFEGY